MQEEPITIDAIFEPDDFLVTLVWGDSVWSTGLLAPNFTHTHGEAVQFTSASRLFNQADRPHLVGSPSALFLGFWDMETGGLETGGTRIINELGYRADNLAWNITTDTTLWARFSEPTLHTITFDTGASTTEISNQSVEQGHHLTRPNDPVLAGHTFVGWYIYGTSTQFEFDNYGLSVLPVTSGLNLVAQFDINVYTVNFENLQGATQPTETTFTIETLTFTLPVLDNRVGWSFVGWFTTLTGGTEVTEIQHATTGNQTVFARWQQINVLVTFNTLGGGFIPPQLVQHTLGRVPNILPEEKIGYSFLGWSVHDENFDGQRVLFDLDNTELTGPITLFAVWHSHPPSPNPGPSDTQSDDSSSPLAWILIAIGAVFAVSALGLIILLLSRKRREQRA